MAKYKEHCKELACQLSICDNAIFELLKLVYVLIPKEVMTDDENKMVKEIKEMRKEITPLIMKE